MNNVTILRLLTAVASGLSTLAALDLAGIAQLFDPATAKYLLAVGPAALAVKEIVVVLGDLFDDGKPNKSFKLGLFGFALAILTLPFVVSCTTPPAVQGEFISKDGRIKVHPDGRFEIIVEPRTGK
ncbi:MAG: hypothetical protein EAZ71_11510 [Verrucomicrobia bacterium]|nr:MAG: hypothetical protein EAZ71_11510 [Verrucomicrobiota bacterium]